LLPLLLELLLIFGEREGLENPPLLEEEELVDFRALRLGLPELKCLGEFLGELELL